MIKSIILIWFVILDKILCQQMNQNISKTGSRLMVLVILTDAFGNSKLVQLYISQLQFLSLFQIKKEIVGIYAFCLSKSSWCVMNKVLLKLMNVIFTIMVSGTTHAMNNLMVLWKIVVQIFSNQCLKCIKLDWCLEHRNHKVLIDFKLFQIHMDHLRIEKFFITEIY